MIVSGNVLNTFNGTLSENPGMGERVRVPFSLTAAEGDTILKQALRVDFFALPDTIPAAHGVSRGPVLNPDLLRLKWGEQDHTVVWYYPIAGHDWPRGFPPLRLANFIWELAQAKVNPGFEAPYSGNDKRIGYIPRFVSQHPLPPGRRFGDPPPRYGYLDIYEDGQWVMQIVAVYRPELEPPPHDTDRLIVLIGEVEAVDLGGKPGTRGSYKGECIYVREWHYLEDEP
jgi:hypothetical protein